MELTDNLISYYKLDGNSNDSVGSNNGADTSVTYSTANGKIGQGAGFNGTSSQIQISGLLGSLPTITISVWANITSKGLNGAEIINIGDYFAIRANDATYKTTMFYHTGSSWVNVTTNTNYIGTGFHLFTAVFDNINHTQSIYVDAVLKGSGIDTNSINYTGGASNTTIGRHPVDTSYFMGGSVDEIGIWSRALSQAEITQLYNGGAGLSYPFLSGASFLYSMI